MFEQVEDVGQGLAVGDLVGAVDLEPLEIGGDAALADPLGDRVARALELAIGVIFEQRRTLGIGETDLNVGVFRAQRGGDAGERAARADGGDETIDLATGLFPDFGASGVDMCLPIGDIVELIGPDRAVWQFLGQLLGEAAGNLDVVVGVLVGLGANLDQLGAE